MTRHQVVAILGALVAGCASTSTSSRPAAPAATASAAMEPGPTHLSAGMDRLGFYVGRWACKGTELADDGSTASVTDLVVEVTPKLDGSWVEVSVFKDGKRLTYELKGYDPSDKKFHHLVAADEGGWGTLTSDGWHGEQMTFVDDHPAPGAIGADRMVFEKKSDVHYEHQAQVAVAGGTYRTVYRKVCDKES